MIPSIDALSKPTTGYTRLESQITWYDSKSSDAQFKYKFVKYAELIVSLILPILVATEVNKWFSITCAGAGIFFEALQQINQWQHNWITYRATCEALRHEKYAFLGNAEPYVDLDDVEARRLLVTRVESHISTEHSKWISTIGLPTSLRKKHPEKA